MRRLVCLHGSPRPGGNSADIAGAVCAAAQSAGAEVRTFRLNSLKYSGCQGCLACKKSSEVCILKDDLTEVLEAVRGCDGLIVATPVYFGEVTAQLKGFIDRSFCYLKPGYPHLPRGQRSRLGTGLDLAFIIAQGHPKEDLFTDIYPRYAYFYRWLGFTQSRLLRACAIYKPGDAQARPEVMAAASTLGLEMAAGLAANAPEDVVVSEGNKAS